MREAAVAEPDGRPLRAVVPLRLCVFLGLAALAAAGVAAAVRSPGGDFANYYTAARVAASGESLAPAYSDMLWFQSRIDAAGFVGQLGGWAPHPPATALVMRPIAGLAPLEAKRVWTAANVALAIACVAALARLAGVGWTGAALALAATGIALVQNFALGQMYLPLLLSLAVGLLLVERGRTFAGGLALGVMLPVKPFAVPLVVYFLLKREWRVVAGAGVGALAVTAVSLVALGWAVHAEYAAVALPHQAAGLLQDPFHPLWQSWHALARRMFLEEPTLNPAPAAAAPWLAGALPAVAVATGWGAVALLARATPGERRLHWAAIVVATLALAPGGASYHLVLLALPYALAIAEVEGRLRWAAAGCAALLALPLPMWARGLDGGWTTPAAYPRLWLLTALLAVLLAALARRAGRLPSRRAVAAVAAAVAVLGVAGALRTLPRAYDAAEPVAVTAPELSGPDRTVMAQPERFDGRLAFLAANPLTGRVERFDAARRLGPAPIDESRGGALSPDRRRLAFVALRDGNEDIYLRDLASGEERRLTTHPARDRDPAWLDDDTLAFASDRGRGLGYTAIYRIVVSGQWPVVSEEESDTDH